MWVGAIQITIDVIQEIHTADSQFFGGRAKFCFASLTHHAKFRANRRVSKPATLAARRRYKVSMNAFTRIFGKRSAHAERFVIGMRENAKQSKVVFHSVYIDPQ
jgi:hypothetical protein